MPQSAHRSALAAGLLLAATALAPLDAEARRSLAFAPYAVPSEGAVGGSPTPR